MGKTLDIYAYTMPVIDNMDVINGSHMNEELSRAGIDIDKIISIIHLGDTKFLVFYKK